MPKEVNVMKISILIIAVLLILLLVSSCAIPKPDSLDAKPGNFTATEDIIKPIIAENKTIDKKIK